MKLCIRQISTNVAHRTVDECSLLVVLRTADLPASGGLRFDEAISLVQSGH